MQLEVYKKSDFYEDYIDSQKEYYERSNADVYFAERLAEKDKEIAELKQKLDDVNELIKTARQMLEDAKATAYADSVDAGMRERRLKRALWIARAERAIAKQAYYDVLSRGISSERGEMYDVWNNVESKCRAKAEEYK